MVEPYYDDGQARFYLGDVRECLRAMPENSVHTVVTSPPYFGLRDYGTARWEGGDEACDHKSSNYDRGERRDRANVMERTTPYRDVCGKCGARRIDNQLGLEATPAEFVANMVEVFREVRRVLRPDGTAWVNMGDSYAAGGAGGYSDKSTLSGFTNPNTKGRVMNAQPIARSATVGCKPKDMVGIPWALAFALRDDGWWLRSDIIWAKPNPMPESVTDRPTKAHEHLFLLAKSATYYYDADAVREVGTGRPWNSAKSTLAANGTKNVILNQSGQRRTAGADTHHEDEDRSGRNRRDVWTIATESFSARELGGDTGGTVSPDCPVHGDSPRAQQVRRDALRDAQRDRSLRGTAGTDAGRVLAPAGEPASTTAPHNGQGYLFGTPEPHTPESTDGSKTTPSSPSATGPSVGAGTTARSSHTPDPAAPSNSDLPSRPCCETATRHSTETHRTGHAPETTPACTASAETPAGTRRSEEERGTDDSAGRSRESSTSAGSAPSVTVTDLSERTPTRSAYTCTCSHSITDHFATFPTALVKPCILAGTSERGCCADCGAPWERVVNVIDDAGRLGKSYHDHTNDLGRGQRGVPPVAGGPKRETTGWRPTCAHEAPVVPCTVLDPFLGSGTTAFVAKSLGRRAVGIDLNAEYLEMAKRRCAQMALMEVP